METVFSGSVLEVVGAIEWHDYSLLFYVSRSSELVVLDGRTVLQVVPVSGQAQISLNHETAALALTNGKNLLIYECVELFGKPPYWKLTSKFEIGEITSLAWSKSDQVALVRDGHTLIWDVTECRSVWEENVGHRRVCAGANKVLSYDPESLVVICIDLETQNFQEMRLSHRPKTAWFITPNVVAVTCDETTFVWQDGELYASIPHCQAIFKTGSDRVLIQLDSFYTLAGERLELAAVSGQIVASTSARIYALTGDTLTVYTSEHCALYQISGFNGPKCMDSQGDMALIGNAVTREGQKLWVSDKQFLQTALLHDCLVGATSNTLGCYSESATVWETNLASFPLLLWAHKDSVFVVTRDSILEYREGSLVETHSLKFHVQCADCSEQALVTYGYGHVEVRSGTQSSFDVSDDIWAVSTAGDYVALATSENVSLRTLKGDEVCCLATKCDAIKLSDRGLAVLARGRLQTYVLVVRVRPRLVLVNDSEVPHIANASPFWKKSEVVLFNGHQLVYPAAQNTKLLEVASQYAVHADSLQELVDKLQNVPIYHPEVLLLIFKALRPQLVFNILATLASQILFGDEEDEVTQISPNLQCRALSDFAAGDYKQLVFKTRFAGLTMSEQKQIEILVHLDFSDLDEHAQCALVLLKVFSNTTGEAWSYAWLSGTKSVLKTRLASATFDVWLDNQALHDEVEQEARKIYAQTRDPTDVTLFYLALRKLDTLKTMWRISGGHPEREKTMKLLKNDFSTQRWQVAAQKNAYALMSRRRFLYAAAFFLLGDAVTDCCQIILSKLDDLSLAVAVARVYDGDRGKGVQFLADRLDSDKWARFFLHSVSGHPAVQDLGLDLATFFLYVQEGGHFDRAEKAEWIARLESRGIPKMLGVLVEELEPQQRQQPEEQSLKPEEPEERKMPEHLKPPPDIPLEPDMSAFGF